MLRVLLPKDPNRDYNFYVRVHTSQICNRTPKLNVVGSI